MSIRKISAFFLLFSAVSCLADQASNDAFTFVRIQWTDNKIRYFLGLNEEVALWAHDYPLAEENLYKALLSATSVKVSKDTKVLTFGDDEIFKYPVLYACEIGYIVFSDKEVETLREYLLRGGFLIIDDFRFSVEMLNWKTQIAKVLPEYRMQKLSLGHPIFHCFFDLREDIFEPIPYLDERSRPEYWAIVDEQDRIMVLMNYNNDVGDGWELPGETDQEHFSKTSFLLGINYIIYALSH